MFKINNCIKKLTIMEGELLCKNIKELSDKIIPKLDPFRKKGDNGVVGVIGGSLEYTGAPFYSAVSALKSGADLAHIFCHKEAATAIKSYSPEIIVHPGFEDEYNEDLL